jgi:hypothetical protein
MMRAPAGSDVGLGKVEGLGVLIVETLGEVAAEFEVLALVIAHGNGVGVV